MCHKVNIYGTTLIIIVSVDRMNPVSKVDAKSDSILVAPLLRGSNLEKALVKLYGKDLTENIASVFVEKLLKAAGTPQEIAELHKKTIKKFYGPLINAFTDKIIEVEKNTGLVPVVLARDAIPIYLVLKAKGSNAKLAWISRASAGIEDEIAHIPGNDGSGSSIIGKYLSELVDGKKALLVDGGMYGSLVDSLLSNPKTTPHIGGAMFLFSKNPNIYGYLNEALSLDGVVLALSTKNITEEDITKFYNGQLSGPISTYIAATIIIDSLECVHPYPMETVSAYTVSNGYVYPVLKLRTEEPEGSVQSHLQAWWEATIQGYLESVNNSNQIVQELKDTDNLYNTIIQSRYAHTGFIHTITPEWSKKPEFLASWKHGIIFPKQE